MLLQQFKTKLFYVSVLGLLTAIAGPIGLQGSFAMDVECEVIDFAQFTHAQSITSIDLFGGDITIGVSATRNVPAAAVNAKAYDTDYSVGEGGCTNLLNLSHNDTQIPGSIGLATPPGICQDCDGIIAQVPDVDFCVSADDTQGGTITFSGFSSSYNWEIPSYDAVDIDDDTQDISLRVGTAQTLVGSTDCISNPACGNGQVVPVATSDHTFTDLAKFEFEGSGGIDNIEICRERFTGCTPGYWKQEQHFGSWEGYDPYTDKFSDSDAFGIIITILWSERGRPEPLENPTLLQALGANGGCINALARHAVAALLNSSNSDLNYKYTTGQIITAVQTAINSNDCTKIEGAAEKLRIANESGCPLN